MNKLTKENIQFIDRYLQNSDIHYEDIRIEMIDHVASEIEDRMDNGEGDFYEIFKEYMMVNKADLENQGKPFKKEIFKSVCQLFFKNIFHWQTLLGSIACFIVIFSIHRFVYSFDQFELIYFPMILLLILGLIPIITFKKKKFSFLGNFFIVIGSFYYLPSIIMPYVEINENLIFSYVALNSIFFVSSLKTVVGMVKYYKKRFTLV